MRIYCDKNKKMFYAKVGSVTFVGRNRLEVRMRAVELLGVWKGV